MQNVISIRAKYKEYFLKKYNVKLGFMSFFTKACIAILKEIPEVKTVLAKMGRADTATDSAPLSMAEIGCLIWIFTVPALVTGLAKVWADNISQNFNKI